MANKFKNFNKSKQKNYGFGFVVVIFLVILTYFSMSKTNEMRVPVDNIQTSVVNENTSTKISSSPAVQQDPPTATVETAVPKEETKVETRRPVCDFSNTKSDICEVDGDVRIIGKDTRLVSVAPSQLVDNQIGESFTIKPYARKWDEGSGAKVRPVTLKLVNGHAYDDQCTVNHSAPALLFAIGGWTGNFFHDFADVLVPLFETGYRFGGNVQLLVANNKPAWVEKYCKFFNRLSRYDIIDYDNDDRVHCFKHVTLGLRCVPDDFRIDSTKDPYGISMTDFTKFMREAYSLERAQPFRPNVEPGKPKLLLISRAGTRKFQNVPEIVEMAKQVGYDVVVTEADVDVTKFSQIVNSCDVIMGVHGSGLTNLVFLPTSSVVIQIVPWGNLDWIAGTYFREPSKLMKLHYLEYSINEEETSLKDKYPRDHAVFKDPMSLHRQGWDIFSRTFLIEQDVRLDVNRFRPMLEKALQLLGER